MGLDLSKDGSGRAIGEALALLPLLATVEVSATTKGSTEANMLELGARLAGGARSLA